MASMENWQLSILTSLSSLAHKMCTILNSEVVSAILNIEVVARIIACTKQLVYH